MFEQEVTEERETVTPAGPTLCSLRYLLFNRGLLPGGNPP